VTHIPLCTVKGCPTRLKSFKGDAHEWHVPWCGHGLEGHHHHVVKRSQGGTKGDIVFICPACHQRIDEHHWGNAVLDIHGVGRLYRVWDQNNRTVFERIIEAAPDEQSPADEAEVPGTLPAVQEEAVVYSRAAPVLAPLEKLSDEELATVFAQADKHQADAFLLKCHVIHTYRERHVQQWGESWAEQAYELFDGAPSRRTLGAYANIWGICDTSGPNLENIGPLTDSRALMQNIGRRKPEDGKVALEAAVAHLAEFGEPPTVAALQHRLGEESKPVDVCPKYGDKHRFICACGKER